MNGGHVEEIKSRLPIDELIGGYVTLEHAGKYLRARCPFHSEKSASFYVSPDRGTYYCFGCGEKGDIFSFIERYEGLDFRGALNLLAERAGVTLAPISKESQTRSDALYGALEAATDFFEKNLAGNPAAKKYLTDRALRDETIKQFRIGYSTPEWSNLTNHLKKLGYVDEIILASGLGIKGDKGVYDRFRGRIMFPVEDSGGRTIGYSARILPELDDGKSGKYVNSPDTELYHKSAILYGFSKAKQHIRKHDFSILVEGQFDVVLSHQFGFPNTVAVSGTAFSAETENQSGVPTHLGLLSKLSKNMILALDNDEAGEKAEIRTLSTALPLGISLKMLETAEGAKDPADILSNEDGVQAWKDMLRRALHPIEALSQRIIKKHSVRSDQITHVKTIILPLIAMFPSALDKHEAARIVEKYFSIPIHSILEDVSSLESKTEVKQKEVSHEVERPDALTVRERFWGLYYASEIPGSVASTYRDMLHEWIQKNIPETERTRDESETKVQRDLLSMHADIQLGRNTSPELFLEDTKLQYEESIFRGILSQVKEELLLKENDSALISRQREIQKTIEEIKEKRRRI